MKIASILFFLFLSSFIFSQEKVEWSVRYNSNLNNIELEANIEKGWHLYSQYLKGDDGPIPTQINFSDNNFLKLIGKVLEPKPIEKFDPNFGAVIAFFNDNVVFLQEIELKENTNLDVVINFMVCNETMCLPPIDKNFKIELKK